MIAAGTETILYGKRNRVMSNEGVMSVITTGDVNSPFVVHRGPQQVKYVADKQVKPIIRRRKRNRYSEPQTKTLRRKPGPKPGQRKEKFIEEDTKLQNIEDVRVPISRKLLKVLLKEHYKIQEHTDDVESISSISIVAKSKKRITKSSVGSTCTTNMDHKIKRVGKKIEERPNDSSSDDFMVIKQRIR